jgi:hypothetical protein
MAWRSSYDKDGSAKARGEQGEFNFAIEAAKRGCDPQKTGAAEDKKHVDWHITINGKRTTCDSKARKALRRGQPVQDEWILLEYRNVAGNKGWLFGEAEWISFEQSDCFILCPRQELVKLWDEIVDMTILAKSSEDAKGTIYSRPDRLDVISHVQNTDVKNRQGVIIWWK